MLQSFTETLKYKLVVMIALAVSLCWVNISSSQEPTCCSRAVAALKTSMPELQERDDSGMITGAINEVFTIGAIDHSPQIPDGTVISVTALWK